MTHPPGSAGAVDPAPSGRACNEIDHGRKLAAGDTEAIWGWTTPAGRIRARRRAEMIIRGAGLRPGIRALELGCGTGLFTALFAQTGAHITAVDISPDLLDRARRKQLPADRVTFVQTRFEDCDQLGPFDAVVGSSVLHHLEVQESIEKIFTLLRPGGVLSFAEPNMLNPQAFLERRFHNLPMFSYVSPDETAFVRWKLKGLLESVGFVDVRITPHDWLHPATPRPLIGTVKALGSVLEWAPLIREFSGSHFIYGRRPDYG